MFGSTVLEIAVGLVFIYLVLSLVCTAVNEYIAQVLNLRAENLYEAIHGLFDGKDASRIAEDIYHHPVIVNLGQKKLSGMAGNIPTVSVRSKPSYIPASAFSMALTDLLGLKEPSGADTSVDPELFKKVVDADTALYDRHVIDALRPLINAANGNLDTARRNIEKWYDDAMERASGWYKRKTQVITILVALGIALIANADSLMILDRLWANPVQRTQIEAVAKNLNRTSPPTAPGTLDKATQDAALGLIGWRPSAALGDPRRLPATREEWAIKLIGLIVTTFAISLGAPFWFDTLNKIMNIRSAGASPNEPPRFDGKTTTPAMKRVASSDAGPAPIPDAPAPIQPGG